MDLNSVSKIKEKFKKNKYSIENNTIDDEDEFYDVCTDFMEEFEEIKELVLTQENIKKYSKEAQRELMSRINSVIDLNAELNNSYYLGEEDSIGNDPIEYTKRMAIFTEMCNSCAHIMEEYIDKNNLRKDKEFKDIKNTLFSMKKDAIEKIVANSLGREDKGIIAGLKKDTSKYENSNVFVVDIPGIGQVSWHIAIDNMNREFKEMLNKNPYPFEVEKNNISGRKVLNSELLLGQIDNKYLSIHNKIDSNIPVGNESELKLALEIYNELLELEGSYEELDAGVTDISSDEKIYRRILKACKRHGIPSKETMDMLLDQMVDNMFPDIEYNKESIRKWRDNEDGKQQPES